MKILSFCERYREWVPVEIEVSLIPGLPQIHLLGLPDQAVKESLIKIKSAIRFQGFDLPKAKQIIVNIRGGDFKKKSPGLDLAIAIGILQRTGQVFSSSEDQVYIFGEISLSGEVFSLNDFILDDFKTLNNFISGQVDKNKLIQNHIMIDELKDLKKIKKINLPLSAVLKTSVEKLNVSDLKDASVGSHENIAGLFNSAEKESTEFFSKRKIKLRLKNQDDFKGLKFSKDEARLLELVALGRHSLLLMGPRGLGKTTLAEALNYLAEAPDAKTYVHYKKYFHHNENEFWRPFVKPHHSVSHLALIGGGAQCAPGEITRAHGGILLLDEMLEFNPKCQDALREPIQNKEVHLVRGRNFQVYPSDFQLVGTTNLCPCGQWLPGVQADCHYSATKCHKYREKLSGPMLDRFEVLYFLKKNTATKKDISLDEIADRVRMKRQKLKELKQSGAEIVFIKDDLSSGLNYRLGQELNSLRRLHASIAIAKTLTLMNDQGRVSDQELEEALSYSWQPFLELKI